MQEGKLRVRVVRHASRAARTPSRPAASLIINTITSRSPARSRQSQRARSFSEDGAFYADGTTAALEFQWHGARWESGGSLQKRGTWVNGGTFLITTAGVHQVSTTFTNRATLDDGRAAAPLQPGLVRQRRHRSLDFAIDDNARSSQPLHAYDNGVLVKDGTGTAKRHLQPVRQHRESQVRRRQAAHDQRHHLQRRHLRRLRRRLAHFHGEFYASGTLAANRRDRSSSSTTRSTPTGARRVWTSAARAREWRDGTLVARNDGAWVNDGQLFDHRRRRRPSRSATRDEQVYGEMSRAGAASSTAPSSSTRRWTRSDRGDRDVLSSTTPTTFVNRRRA